MPDLFAMAFARSIAIVVVGVAFCAIPKTTWAWTIGVAPSTTKVLPDTPMPTRGDAKLEAARGEWEGFQIVIRDGAGATGVDVTLSDLCAGASCIPSSEARLYREWFVDVVQASPGNIVDHTRLPGSYPDPLVPLRDPYSGTGAPVGAPFDLAATDTGVVFVDVHVPAGTAHGTYTGTATVTATDRNAQIISVSLDVWDFDMPAQRTVATAFGFSPKGSWTFHGGPQDGDTPERDVIGDRYALALHEHRIDPQSIGGPIEYSFDANGQLQPIDFTAYDAAARPWIDGTKFGDGIGVARFEVGQFSPGHGTGTMTDAQYAEAGKAFAEHMQANGWWTKAYTYAADEPWLNDPQSSFAAIDHDADLLMNASDLWRGHVLVTSPFEQQIAGRIGIWCPGDSMYENWNGFWGTLPGRDVYAQRMAQGEELWFYVSNANEPPYAGYDIDTAIGYEPRIIMWGAFYERATGFLYWETEHWTNDDPWNVLLDTSFGPLFSRNGDGFLLYPGNHDGTAQGKGSPAWLAIDGPIVSYRMKQIRDGLEDWEMFRMAASLGAEDYVRAQVARAYTRFGAFLIVNCDDVGDYCPDDQPWTLDETVLADVRHNVAAKILYLLHPGQYPDPEPPPFTVTGGCNVSSDAPSDVLVLLALALLEVSRRRLRSAVVA